MLSNTRTWILSFIVAIFLSHSAFAQQLPKCTPKGSQKLAIQVDGVVFGFVKTARLLRKTPDLSSPVVAVSLEDGLILDGSYFSDWKTFNANIPRPVIFEKHDINLIDALWNLMTGDFKLGKTRLSLEEANIKTLDMVQTDQPNCFFLRKSTFLFDKLTKQ